MGYIRDENGYARIVQRGSFNKPTGLGKMKIVLERRDSKDDDWEEKEVHLLRIHISNIL